ncbi:ABC transporter permease [Exiguobacterium aurantiacum]|uniref:ABC transporter permease n=1 Tax=Exiguobacterium aurantiacum TaxID=33987 RepID=UPI0008779A49|nr:ABC transporter permease [Exiguobacterium aurantiacum]
MTARYLLKRRVIDHAAKHWKTWRLRLYVVFPLFFFLGYQYILFWQGGLDWIGDVSAFVWAVLFLLLVVSDTFFIWVERADVTRSTGDALIKVLKRYSLSYHIVKLIIKYGVVVSLFRPVLVDWGWTHASILSFFLSVLLIAWLHMWTQYQLQIRRSHWMLRVSVTIIAMICLYAFLDGRPLAAVVFGSGFVALALYAGEGWMSRQPYLDREIDLAEALHDSFFQKIKKGHFHD